MTPLTMTANVEAALLALTFLPQTRLASCLQGQAPVSHETVREALEEFGARLLADRLALAASQARERELRAAASALFDNARNILPGVQVPMEFRREDAQRLHALLSRAPGAAEKGGA